MEMLLKAAREAGINEKVKEYLESGEGRTTGKKKRFECQIVRLKEFLISLFTVCHRLSLDDTK
jgi:hypothetical protein